MTINYTQRNIHCMSNISDDHKKILKEAYIDDPSMSLKAISNMSKEIAGVHVSEEMLKILSMREGWGVEKRRISLGKVGLPTDVSDEADDLRLMVYNMIMDPESKQKPQDLIALIKTWEGIRAASPKARSGKTARQQQIEATKHAVELLEEYRATRAKRESE